MADWSFLRTESLHANGPVQLMVTRRTISDGVQIYPMDGLCTFGPAKQSVRIPWPLVIASVFVLPAVGGLIQLTFRDTSLAALAALVAFLLLCSPFALFIWNFAAPSKPGLLLGFASGENRFFPSTDTAGMGGVTADVARILNGVDDNGLKIDVRSDKVGGHLIVGGGTAVGNVTTGAPVQ